MTRAKVVLAMLVALVLVPAGDSALAAPAPPVVVAPVLVPVGGGDAGHQPFIHLDVGAPDPDGGLAPVLKIVLMLAALTFIPAVLLAMTSFTRIVIVLSMVRQGLGLAQLPPNRIIVALSLFLTFFTMAPVFADVNDKALVPYEAGKLEGKDALEAAAAPLRVFMLSHTRESDLMLFLDLSQSARPDKATDVPLLALIPAFILSELKTAFQMGALLLLPFLVIDLVVGSVLMSMGMMMLAPATISLPLKILTFVAVDGWTLVVGSLARSFRG